MTVLKKTRFNLISQQKNLFGSQKDRTLSSCVQIDCECEYSCTQHFSTSACNKFLVKESLLE